MIENVFLDGDFNRKLEEEVDRSYDGCVGVLKTLIKQLQSVGIWGKSTDPGLAWCNCNNV